MVDMKKHKDFTLCTNIYKMYAPLPKVQGERNIADIENKRILPSAHIYYHCPIATNGHLTSINQKKI
jgi:hypothetical protein